MYTEEYQHNGFFLRKLLLKIILIIAIILLFVWLLPRFLAYKPSNNKTNNIKVTEENTNDNNLKQNLIALKDAALLYYKADKLPENKNDIELVTLKELKKENLISDLTSSTNKSCNIKKSYAKLTKLDNDYLLKVYLDCSGKKDYLLVHVGKYDYCTNSVCEKDSTKEEKISSNNTEEIIKESSSNIAEEKPQTEENNETKENNSNSNNNSNNSTIARLSNFSAWSSYEKTSCDTKEITCGNNDFNCLTEVRTKKETEQVGNYNKEYYTLHLTLHKTSTTEIAACNSYNYINIQNQLYKTKGNYEEIFSINRTSTANWTYKGTISTTVTPNFGSNKYYKFIGADFKDCSYTCLSEPAYYYDVYEYTKTITKTANPNTDCQNIVNKNVNNYTIVKKKETVKRSEPLYANACYKSIRTRKIIK